ncbi:MAG: hypothetical protein JNG88_04310 [Phycisphaerales bacterium]|nr:hypothetical protein [Phycisphaerales bacterium]
MKRNTNGNGRLLRLATLAILGAGFSPTILAQSIQSIGILSPTGNSEAFAVNADGSAVVGYSSYGSALRAVRWTPTGGLQNLGVLPGGVRTLGFAVSAEGDIVTGMGTIPGGGHVFLWTPAGGIQDLGTLAGQNVSYGFAMSADGFVVGGGPSSAGAGHALRWTEIGGLEDLGTIPSDEAAALYALSADGSAGAGYSGMLSAKLAMYWSASSGMERIGALPGGLYSEASAISSDGQYVTGFSDSSNGVRAFLWSRADNSMQDLGVATGRTLSYATGISSTGEVVVGYDEAGAVIWDKTNGMRALSPVLTSLGVNLTGWSLSYCYAISSDGTALVGAGRFNGQLRGWVVRGLPSLCAPEITQQPAGIRACSGFPVTFSIDTSSPNVAFQWQVNADESGWIDLQIGQTALPCGGNVVADTPNAASMQASLSPCVQVSDYAFRCTVSNTCGQRASDAAHWQLIRTGDMNCDCAVNNFDIDPFVLALTAPEDYAAAYPSCDIRYGDVNHDGFMNNFDIDSFVQCLTSAGCP